MMTMQLHSTTEDSGRLNIVVGFNPVFETNEFFVDDVSFGRYTLRNSLGKFIARRILPGSHRITIESTNISEQISSRFSCSSDFRAWSRVENVLCDSGTIYVPWVAHVAASNINYWDESIDNFETAMQLYAQYSISARRVVLYRPSPSSSLSATIKGLHNALGFAWTHRYGLCVTWLESKWAKWFVPNEEALAWTRNCSHVCKDPVPLTSIDSFQSKSLGDSVELAEKTSISTLFGAMVNSQLRSSWAGGYDATSAVLLNVLIRPSDKLQAVISKWVRMFEDHPTVMAMIEDNDVHAMQCIRHIMTSSVKFLLISPHAYNRISDADIKKRSLVWCEEGSLECNSLGLSREGIDAWTFWLLALSKTVIITNSSEYLSLLELAQAKRRSKFQSEVYIAAKDGCKQVGNHTEWPQHSNHKEMVRKTDEILPSIDNIVRRSRNLRSLGDNAQARKLLSFEMQRRNLVVVDWALDMHTGWSTLGRQLCSIFWKRHNVTLLPTTEIDNISSLKLPSDQREALEQAQQHRPLYMEWLASSDSNTPLEIPVLYAVGDNMSGNDGGVKTSSVAAGIVFAERTHFTSAAIESAIQYDVLIAGSTWMSDILRKAIKHNNIHMKPQGVDVSMFCGENAKRSSRFKGRFVVFSGGKLELRKGQDIVLTAFKKFYSSHKDALLVTSWQNNYRSSAMDIHARGLVKAPPQWDEKRQKFNISAWIRDNGLKKDAFLSLDLMPSLDLSHVMCSADAAVYASRCEAGINLFALQSMACGVPTIISNNTGHKDIIGPSSSLRALPLNKQAEIRSNDNQTIGWGESSPEEIVRWLEWIYSNKSKAQEIGQRGRAAMESHWSWQHRGAHITDAIIHATREKTGKKS